MHRFTSEFGMGSGGSSALLLPGNWFGDQAYAWTPEFEESLSKALEIAPAIKINNAWLYDQAARTISTG